ncbi:RDD family protein [Streptomyces sp. NPDC007172]|uniref:RDD family protein n=1 Tax=Streptomyces sp. NPDC007172 TaxID=3364776 RepID=UPI0036922E04
MSDIKTAQNPLAPDLPCAIGSHFRRDLAVLLDMLWALLCGLIALAVCVVAQAGLATMHGSDVPWKRIALLSLAVGVAMMVAASFANQVLLTVWTRASLGKHALSLRVVRVDSLTRPRFPQAVRRWLYGLGFVIVVLPFAALQLTDIGGPDGPRHDAMGLRIVRSSCLTLRGQCPHCATNHAPRRRT